MIAIVTLTALIVLWPADAWAWGPYAHLDFGHQVLKNISLLPAGLRALLGAYPFDYLYGCIYADVIIGKNRAVFSKHCHNWKVAFEIYHLASTQRQRAFMLGYLSHLAADVIAHNYFVPFKIVESWPTRFLRHLYWELRFDQKLFHKVEDVAKKVARQDMQENQTFLAQHLVRTLFSMKVNKRLFRGFVVLQNLDRWQKLITQMARRSNWPLHHEDYVECSELAMNSIFSMLIDFEDSPTVLVDARGELTIGRSLEIRRDLKLAFRDRKGDKDFVQYVGDEYKDRFRAGIFDRLSLPLAHEVARRFKG